MTHQDIQPSDSQESIRILIVDDHGLVREGIGGMLERESDMHIAGLCATADEAIRLAVEQQPDVIVMDIDMPGLSCFDAVEIIRSRLPKIQFLLVTAYEHDEHIEQALRAKISGFVSKNDGHTHLAEAIRNVARGQAYYSDRIMKRLVIEGDTLRLEQPPKSRLASLSPRERELLRVLARGASLKDAASVLGISYKTADKQKVSLMAKLDIHNRVDLARFAIREGLVEP